MDFVPSKHFEKAVRKLPRKIQTRLAERLRLFAIDPWNPLLNNHALNGSKQSFRSINVTGDHRLIFEEVETGIAYLIDVDTHSNLYGE